MLLLLLFRWFLALFSLFRFAFLLFHLFRWLWWRAWSSRFFLFNDFWTRLFGWLLLCRFLILLWLFWWARLLSVFLLILLLFVRLLFYAAFFRFGSLCFFTGGAGLLSDLLLFLRLLLFSRWWRPIFFLDHFLFRTTRPIPNPLLILFAVVSRERLLSRLLLISIRCNGWNLFDSGFTLTEWIVGILAARL